MSPYFGLKVTSRKGKNNPNYGKTHTLEVRNKISNVHRGKKCSESTTTT